MRQSTWTKLFFFFGENLKKPNNNNNIEIKNQIEH